MLVTSERALSDYFLPRLGKEALQGSQHCEYHYSKHRLMDCKEKKKDYEAVYAEFDRNIVLRHCRNSQQCEYHYSKHQL